MFIKDFRDDQLIENRTDEGIDKAFSFASYLFNPFKWIIAFIAYAPYIAAIIYYLEWIRPFLATHRLINSYVWIIFGILLAAAPTRKLLLGALKGIWFGITHPITGLFYIIDFVLLAAPFYTFKTIQLVLSGKGFPRKIEDFGRINY